MREIQDGAGTAWRVVQVDPDIGGGRSELLPAAMRKGWLVFESPGERRRLSPIPAGWETLPEQGLLLLCAEAVPAAQLRLE